MNRRHRQAADQVLAAFRTALDEADRQRIGEAGFEALHALVCEALSEELAFACARVAQVVDELHAEVDRPPLEL